ncbi:hypothetical protein [Brassicibacter mesophilus]|uniref:hypothetical protein n=1 Tax=Brassicibacter mesophilus TaxID=745119 RepID=UPI003D23B99B
MSIFQISDKKIKTKIDMTISEYMNNINKFSELHKKQIEFAKTLANMIYTKKDKSIVDVIIARCGIGKSIFIKSFLKHLVNDYCYIGQMSRNNILETCGSIVVTDSLERLEEIIKYEGLQDRCYFVRYNKEELESKSRIDFQTQLKEQFKYPIILITTQKYFKMSKSERNILYKWAKGTREIAIIDEKPIMMSETIVDEQFLSEIKVAIHKCYEGNEKNYLLDTFEKIYDDLDYIRKNYSRKYEVMWLKNSKPTLLLNEEEDKKFFDILANNVSSYIYNSVLELKRIYTDGCLFVNKKNREQDNKRQFILLESNEDKFDTENCKYYILDATAKYDVDYLINDEKFNYIEIDDKKDVKDINIHHITFGASQRRLKVDNYSLESIAKWINNNFDDNALVLTYGQKSGIYQKFSKILKTNEMAYFGSIKGKNDWEDKKTMIQIGFNRQSDVVYLLTYIYLNKKYNDWNSMSNLEIEKETEKLLLLEKGIFLSKEMNWIMRSKILVDTEQNIMRIKCRHFSNKELCNVYIINNQYYSNYIERLADKLNADFKSYLPNEFIDANIENYGDKETTISKLIKWVKKYNGTPILVNDFKKKFELSDYYWKKLFRNNINDESIKRFQEIWSNRNIQRKANREFGKGKWIYIK